MQPAQPCRTGLDARGAAPHRGAVPAPRRRGRSRRDTLRAGDAGIPLYAVRLALRGVRTPLGNLHLAEQGIQPRRLIGQPLRICR